MFSKCSRSCLCSPWNRRHRSIIISFCLRFYNQMRISQRFQNVASFSNAKCKLNKMINFWNKRGENVILEMSYGCSNASPVQNNRVFLFWSTVTRNFAFPPPPSPGERILMAPRPVSIGLRLFLLGACCFYQVCVSKSKNR